MFMVQLNKPTFIGENESKVLVRIIADDDLDLESVPLWQVNMAEPQLPSTNRHTGSGSRRRWRRMIELSNDPVNFAAATQEEAIIRGDALTLWRHREVEKWQFDSLSRMYAHVPWCLRCATSGLEWHDAGEISSKAFDGDWLAGRTRPVERHEDWKFNLI